jgi:hypothetical protein
VVAVTVSFKNRYLCSVAAGSWTHAARPPDHAKDNCPPGAPRKTAADARPFPDAAAGGASERPAAPKEPSKAP